MNKKGFTLIELLAVILILAVISIITVPIVLNMIESARKAAAIDSAYGYVEAIEHHLSSFEFKNEKIDLEYGKNSVEEINNKVEYRGKGPITGEIIINKNKRVEQGINLCISGYSVQYKIGEKAYINGKCEKIEGENEQVIEDKKACELEQDKENVNIYYIDSSSDLYQLSKEVDDGNNFNGKTIVLRNSIDMSNVKNKCGEESFKPIGQEKVFSGTFDGLGKTISNLVINRIDEDNVGLFGQNAGTIKGLNLDNIDIKGKNNVGGLAGYSSGDVKEVTIRGKVYGEEENIGGLFGRTNGGYYTANVSSILLNVDVSKGEDAKNVAGTIGNFYGYNTKNIILESGKIEGPTGMGVSYYSDKVEATSYGGVKFDLRINRNINAYETVIDTYIGGDDDDSGYYFDYNNSGQLAIRSIKEYPITFDLKGSGTEEDPYLIESVEDWKKATIKADQVGIVFKLTKDIDFTGKNFYMLGSNQNRFSGRLLGNNHTLKGIETKGGEYQGIIGYITSKGEVKSLNIENFKLEYGINSIGSLAGISEGTIEEINVNNISIVGNENVGGFIGSVGKDIKGINIDNINIRGNTSVGGLAGYSTADVKEVTIRGKVYGEGENIGGLFGRTNGGYYTANVSSILLNVDVSKGEDAKDVAGTIGNFYGYNTKNIILESGKIEGPTGTGVSYYSDKVEATSYGGIKYSSSHINDLTYYDELLDVNNPIIESKYTGDVNKSGYFFDYGADSKIKAVKSYQYNVGNANIDENYTMTHIEGTTDTTAPTCKLDYVVAVPNGIRASFSCTDESVTPTISSLFDSTTSKSAKDFNNIGTVKTGVVNGNKRSVISTWTTNDSVSKPTRGTCYYFRYGAKDSQGNYTTYVTDKCYMGFN